MNIDGRDFVIKRIEALTGSYVAFKLSSKLLPLGLGGKLSENGIQLQNTATVEMSRAEFTELQMECLKVCFEEVGGKQIPVLNDNGSFRANDLEDDVKTVLTLTVQAVVFNAQSFFEGNLLEKLASKFSAMSHTDAQT